jgi:membrane-bound serine protease (ClpP class)
MVLALALVLASTPVMAGVVHVLPFEGPITPVAEEYLVGGMEAAAREDADAVLIELDTPGGLDSSMRNIVKTMLASPVPVVVYVAPSGSRAASAGVFLTMAAHVAAMAPGTNIGSASPVSMMGASMDSTMSKKVTNDAVAYLQGLAKERGRNVAWAERFVVDADNIPADEALSENVIDLVATSRAELLQALDGRVVRLPSGDRTLALSPADLLERPMSWRLRILSALANPTVAYMLLLLGVYGIFFELSNPGSILPGVLGSIAILMALFAFQALPVNYAGLALILLAVVLFILEIYVTSFGLLSIGGIASLVLGSMLLFDSGEDWARLSLRVVVPTVAVTGGFFALCVWLAIKGQRKPVVTGAQAMVGESGRVLEALAGDGAEGKVVFHGEIWRAVSEVPVAAGDRVRVVAIEGRVARVEGESTVVPK